MRPPERWTLDDFLAAPLDARRRTARAFGRHVDHGGKPETFDAPRPNGDGRGRAQVTPERVDLLAHLARLAEAERSVAAG